MGALTAQDREIVSDSPDELRSMIRSGRKQAATTRITAPRPGPARLDASYQWTDTHRWHARPPTAPRLSGPCRVERLHPAPDSGLLDAALRMEA